MARKIVDRIGLGEVWVFGAAMTSECRIDEVKMSLYATAQYVYSFASVNNTGRALPIVSEMLMT